MYGNCERFDQNLNTLKNEQTYTKYDLASDDCQVGDWAKWGECFGNVCGGSGKQYRQRYYRTPDKATKCHRKLFETRSCMMSLCTYGILNWNNDFACPPFAQNILSNDRFGLCVFFYFLDETKSVFLNISLQLLFVPLSPV